jgi:hypothetical protein
VLWVLFIDYKKLPLAANDFVVRATLLDGGSHFHSADILAGEQ